MSIYKICPHCRASLDPGEACGCIAARYDVLTPDNRARLDSFAPELTASLGVPVADIIRSASVKTCSWSGSANRRKEPKS